jgi:hypothetical protein
MADEFMVVRRERQSGVEPPHSIEALARPYRLPRFLPLALTCFTG